MKKIIVKHKLASREKLVEKLKDMEMELAPAYYQQDRVYVPRNYKPNASYARMVLRTELMDVGKKPRYRMILKRHIADSGIDIVNDMVIKDYDEAVHMLQQLGFEKKAELSRRREELKLNDDSRMFIDKIDGLPGYYVKIEYDFSDDEKVSEARDDVTATFGALGMKSDEELKETYADIKAD